MIFDDSRKWQKMRKLLLLNGSQNSGAINQSDLLGYNHISACFIEM
jgi:hypothetical protein